MANQRISAARNSSSASTTGPTVSVLIPAYNAQKTIASTIGSVLAQTRSDFEIIVVDDGSTDETAARLQPFLCDSRIRLVSQSNQGPSAALNTAIANAEGRYVSILGSDDLWLPRYIETMAGALDADPAATVAYTDAWTLDDATRRIARMTAMASLHPPRAPENADEFLRALLKYRNFVFAGATVRRAVFAEVGDFRVELPGSEDYELWLRIAARGYTFVRCFPKLAIYRRRSGQLTSDSQKMLENEKEVCRIVAEEYDVPDDVRALAQTCMERQDRLLTTLASSRSRRVPRPFRHLYRGLSTMRHFYLRPPPAVREAFPDLRRL